MVLGPIPIILNSKKDGETLGNTNDASTEVNEDKKAKVEGSRFQTPFIGPLSEEDTKKQTTTNKLPSDLNLLNVTESNAKTRNKLVINPATGRIDGTAGESVREPFSKVSNKEEDLSTGSKSFGQSEQDNIAPEFKVDIKPRPNPFKGFASMTYSISIYIMSPAQYIEMVSSGVKSVKGLTLILQSGGVSNNPSDNYGAVRSEYFKRDFYIDDIILESLVSGTSVGQAHNVFTMQFKIIEPNGLTFLDNLHAAIQKYNVENGISEDRINYGSQNFLMTVRFYGYDENGKQITGRDVGITENLSDLSSVSEKFIPFQFSDISFRLDGDQVEYRCQAVAPQSQIPFGVGYATIPFNTELTGQTVQDVLSDLVLTTAEEDADNEVGGFTGYGVSLMESLNIGQQNLVGEGVQEYPNIYRVEFEKGSGIAEASVLTTSDSTDKEKTKMTEVRKKQESLLTNKGFYNKNTKQFSLQAGQSIVQAIDMILRTSTYISNQQNIVINEVTGEVKKKEKSPEVLQWYKIRTRVKPLQYDRKRNDYAYEITYIISRYQINNLRSPYFGPSYFRGVHKEYDYWFTGQNTEVLDFQQDYNYLYFQTMGADMATVNLQNNARELTKRYYQNSSSESTQGGKNRRNEGAANAASLLYSPADQATANLSILGDPDFIAQSELFYAPDGSDLELGPFVTDGSINYDASEVLFAVNYNTIVDYDLTKGIAPTSEKNFGVDLGSGKNTSTSRISLIYRANTITTILSKGAFTQKLEGTQMLFPTDQQLEVEKKETKTQLEAKNPLEQKYGVNEVGDTDSFGNEIDTDDFGNALPYDAYAAFKTEMLNRDAFGSDFEGFEEDD